MTEQTEKTILEEIYNILSEFDLCTFGGINKMLIKKDIIIDPFEMRLLFDKYEKMGFLRTLFLPEKGIEMIGVDNFDDSIFEKDNIDIITEKFYKELSPTIHGLLMLGDEVDFEGIVSVGEDKFNYNFGINGTNINIELNSI